MVAVTVAHYRATGWESSTTDGGAVLFQVRPEPTPCTFPALVAYTAAPGAEPPRLFVSPGWEAHRRFRAELAAEGGRRAWARALLRRPDSARPPARRCARRRRGTTFVRRIRRPRRSAP